MRSRQTRGRPRGTAWHSGPSTIASPPQHCDSPSKRIRPSGSPSQISTPSPKHPQVPSAAARRTGNATTSKWSALRQPETSLEPPTCSENTSPALAATHSLCASSSTFDGPPDTGTSSRTSPAIFPVATRLGRRYRRSRNDRASAPANRTDIIIISGRKGPVHARSDRRLDRRASGTHAGVAEREPSKNGICSHAEYLSAGMATRVGVRIGADGNVVGSVQPVG